MRRHAFFDRGKKQEEYECTYQIVKAKNKLPGPPFSRPRPIWTYSAVPIVPPMPMSWICLGFNFRWVLSYPTYVNVHQPTQSSSYCPAFHDRSEDTYLDAIRICWRVREPVVGLQRRNDRLLPVSRRRMRASSDILLIVRRMSADAASDGRFVHHMWGPASFDHTFLIVAVVVRRSRHLWGGYPGQNGWTN